MPRGEGRQYSEDELLAALELASLRAAVDALDGGLDHPVKEKGGNFSAGEVQLLCLARVLLKRPLIVLMDEATASVDHATDAAVQRTIRSALVGSTIVTIAHRLNTIIVRQPGAAYLWIVGPHTIAIRCPCPQADGSCLACAGL